MAFANTATGPSIYIAYTVALQCRSRSRDSDSITLDFRLQTRFDGLRLRASGFGFQTRFDGLRLRTSGFGLDSTGSGFRLWTRLQRASGFGLWASDSIAAGFRLWARLQQALGSRLWMGLHWTSDLIATDFCPVRCKLPAFFLTFDLTVYHTCAHWHVLVFADQASFPAVEQ